MSNFVVTDYGIVLNRTAAADGRVPLAAWDLGSASDTGFLSTEPLVHTQGAPSPQVLQGRWSVVCESEHGQVLVHAHGQVIGPVNRRASAILAPLLQGRLIDVEVQQNQEAGGQTGKALYIFAKLGKAGNQQVVREPATTQEARAYVALLACTMKALKAADQNPDRDTSDSNSGQEDMVPLEDASGFSAASWHKLPGAVQWDTATGSIGNTVNLDLIDQLGSRTLAMLRKIGAPVVQRDSSP